MNLLDYILLGLIIFFTFWGLRKGFLQALGALFGIVIATVLAGRFYLILGERLGDTNLSSFLAFLIIFSLVLKLVGLMFWIFGKLFKLISIVPFLQTFDRLLGAILGMSGGILILSILVLFLSKYPFNAWLLGSMRESIVTLVLIKISYIFVPLMPETINKIKSFL